MGEFLNGLCALWSPQNDSDGCCADACCHPEKILHSDVSLVLLDVGAAACLTAAAIRGWMQGRGAWMGAVDGLHCLYGFGTVWTGVGDWDSPGGEDGGGCGG